MATPPLMEKIVALCKRRGFIFQSSEIYGGINGFWDYGPPGAELKRNIKDAWWNDVVRSRDDVVGIDGIDHHAPARLGGLRPRRPRSPIRWWTARSAKAAGAPINCRKRNAPKAARTSTPKRASST